ncbi:Cold-regulated 413 plasma membrane protein 2 [Heracleum sosnowskyi]|uniref:Cold-regulated 413 plasma membrane protein 2 n=1 Tax=Heracleum sosnowskyi TaxID=360622 RepID=A0AAD8H3Y3_9APIA|nr:Cold-regulated 413 plasma membrane protein 2 [Heracleum sosnowskyi]
MKDMYFPDLNEIYQKVAAKMHQTLGFHQYKKNRIGVETADISSKDKSDSVQLKDEMNRAANSVRTSESVICMLFVDLGCGRLRNQCGITSYLLILDGTNWRTNMLTGLLVSYIFFSFPWALFNLFRGEAGKWIAFVAVVLRLFFPRHFPDWLEMPGSLILLLVVYQKFRVT